MGEKDLRPNTNLPSAVTTFIGREKLVDEIERVVIMEPPECRLLTVTGAGGTGKTRVALHVARAVGRRSEYRASASLSCRRSHKTMRSNSLSSERGRCG